MYPKAAAPAVSLSFESEKNSSKELWHLAFVHNDERDKFMAVIVRLYLSMFKVDLSINTAAALPKLSA